MNAIPLFAMLMRRRVVLLATFVVALIALPFILIKLKPTYIATSHVLMVGKDSMIPSTDMGSLTISETVIRRIAERFGLTADVSTIRGHVDAKASLRSNVMPISYRDKDPKVALQVTNALADETVTYYKELSGGQYDQMVAYLRGAAQREKDRIHSIDETLQRAAQRDTYVGSDSALETITARINDLESARAAAYATMVSDEAIAAAQSAQPREIAGIVKQEVLVNDPYVVALRTGQAHDAAQLQFQRAQYTERYPGLPSLQDQVQRESSVLDLAENSAVKNNPSASASYAATVLARRSAVAVAAGDRAKVKAIDDQVSAEESHLRDLPSTGSAVSVLRAERDGAKTAYAATIARLNDTQANQAAAASLGSIVVIDRATDAGPRIPRLAMDIIVAFILLALTVAIAYAVDVLDPSLRSPDAIERLYGLPIVGNLGSRR
jgi:succinoglycan biosynthesis transport protein ExoP